jgi:hypothetical protein
VEVGASGRGLGGDVTVTNNGTKEGKNAALTNLSRISLYRRLCILRIPL